MALLVYFKKYCKQKHLKVAQKDTYEGSDAELF